MGKINEHDQIVKAKRTLHAAPTCQEYGFEPAPARHIATEEEIRRLSQEILQSAGGLAAVDQFEIKESSGTKRIRVKRWLNAKTNQERLEFLKNSPLIDKILVGTKNNDIVIAFKEAGDAERICTILSGKLEGYQEAIRENQAKKKAEEESRGKAEREASEKAAREAEMKERLKREAREREERRKEEQAKAAEEAARRKTAEEAERAKKAAEEAERRKAAGTSGQRQNQNVPLSICSPGLKVKPAEVDGLVSTIIHKAGGKKNIKDVSRTDRNLVLTLNSPYSSTELPGWTHLAVAYVKDATTAKQGNNDQKIHRASIHLNNGEAAFLAYGKLCKKAGHITGAQIMWSYILAILFVFMANRMTYAAGTAFLRAIIPGFFLGFLVMLLMLLTHRISLSAAVLFALAGLVQRNIAGVPITADLIGQAVGAFFGFWIVFLIVEAIIMAIARSSARKK